MSVEENKKIALRMVETLIAGGMDLSLFSNDAQWWNPGSGLQPLGDFLKVTEKFKSARAGNASVDIVGLLAEDGRVAVEADGHIPLKNGTMYENHYVFILTIVDGKIVLCREYADSLYAAEALKGVL